MYGGCPVKKAPSRWSRGSGKPLSMEPREYSAAPAEPPTCESHKCCRHDIAKSSWVLENEVTDNGKSKRVPKTPESLKFSILMVSVKT